MRYTLICIILLSAFNLQARNLFPEDYHLGGDDYTDAIQECIDIASQTGQKVELKGESYKVTGGKLKLRSNVTLFSQVGSRVYTCDRNNYKSIFYQDLGDLIQNINIKGIYFDQSQEADSPYFERINYFVILLYRAQNVTIENCRFIHVGTNCIVINGPECTGSKILSNDIKFVRIQSAGHYDVSSIYITDGNHRIIKNRIYNDGKEVNRQGGGIETHGPYGVVKGNNIFNCYNAINVVSSDNVNPRGYNRIISRNISTDCYNFAILWSISGQQIKNVKIKNNIATGLRTAVGVQPGNELAGSIDEILITKNKFVGVYHEFVNEANANMQEHLLKYEAIALHNHGHTKICVAKNLFYDFPAILVDVNAYNKDVCAELAFIKNQVINAYNSKLLEPLLLQDKFSLFCVGLNARLVARDNVISVQQLDSSISPTLIYGYKEGHIELSNNQFPELDISISRANTINIDSRICSAEYKAREFTGVTPVSLNKGDRILKDGDVYTCTQQGTNKTVVLSNGILHGGREMYLTCDNSGSLQLGDWILIAGEGISQQARQVIAIVEGRVYLQDVNCSLRLGEKQHLTKIAYFPYKLEKSL